MNFNESIEFILPFKRGEESSLGLLLHSLQVSCVQNDIYVTIVDLDNCVDELKKEGSRIFDSSRLYVASTPEGLDSGLTSAYQWGFLQAQELRPETYFVAFGHVDWIGVASNWLDLALEVLLDQQVGAVGYTPSGKLYALDQEVDYVDDWLIVTKREVVQKALPFPTSLKSFGFAPWFHMAIALEGWGERILQSADGNPLVAHSRRVGRVTGGRRAQLGAELEHQTLQAELQKLTRERAQ